MDNSNIGVLTRTFALSETSLTDAVIAMQDVGRSAWFSARARFQAARNAWDAHPYGVTPQEDPDYDRLNSEDVMLMKQDEAALNDLLRTPAPNITAATEKLEMCLAELDLDDRVALVIADLRRLAAH